MSYRVVDNVNLYDVESFYSSNRQKFSDLYTDQIDFYPNLIKDFTKIFFRNTHYRSRFGINLKHSSLEYEQMPTYKDVLLNEELLSYLSKHETALFLYISFIFIKTNYFELSTFHKKLIHRMSALFSESEDKSLKHLSAMIDCLCRGSVIENTLSNSKHQDMLIVNYSKNENEIIKAFERIKRAEGYQEQRCEFIKALINRGFVTENLSRYFSKKLTKNKVKSIMYDIEGKIRDLNTLERDTSNLQKFVANIINDNGKYCYQFWYMLDAKHLTFCLPTVAKHASEWEQNRIKKHLEKNKDEN